MHVELLDSKVSKFGDIKFDARFSHLVFSEFGRMHIKGQSGEYHNPTFDILRKELLEVIK